MMLKDFDEWLKANKDRKFRYWVYRKVYTPYEQSEKFVDESMYEDPECETGKIVEAAKLPDGDIMLGFKDDYFDYDYISYYRLSEIRLEYSEKDKYEA